MLLPRRRLVIADLLLLLLLDALQVRGCRGSHILLLYALVIILVVWTGESTSLSQFDSRVFY